MTKIRNEAGYSTDFFSKWQRTKTNFTVTIFCIMFWKNLNSISVKRGCMLTGETTDHSPLHWHLKVSLIHLIHSYIHLSLTACHLIDVQVICAIAKWLTTEECAMRKWVLADRKITEKGKSNGSLFNFISKSFFAWSLKMKKEKKEQIIKY